MMNGAKINNLGLSFLIHLNLFVEYLSFIGGEAQRPIPNSYGRAAPGCDSLSSYHLNHHDRSAVGKNTDFSLWLET